MGKMVVGFCSPPCYQVVRSGRIDGWRIALADVQKVTERDYQEWRAKDPEAFDDAFSRDYDPGYGQRFNGWVEGGME